MKINTVLKKVGEKASAFTAKIGKRNLIVICAVLLLGGAVYLNFVLFGDSQSVIGYGDNNMEDDYYVIGEGSDNGIEVNEEYFASTEISRQKARDEALEVLQTVVESPDALDATKEQALADISQIAKDIASESNIESLVSAKGFDKCVAVVNGISVSVVVDSDTLTPSEVAQINEIVFEQTGALPENVKIVERS